MFGLSRGTGRRSAGRAARYFTPSGRSIQAKGVEPDIKVLQEVPDDLKARTEAEGEASLRGHLKAEGNEE
jgi:carboxyl-terminal processing protease